MKKITITLTLLVALLLSGCSNVFIPLEDNCNEEILFFGDLPMVHATASRIPFTLEETFMQAGYVVVAQFVGQRVFASYILELEFEVSEHIYGNASDTVFIYLDYRFTDFTVPMDSDWWNSMIDAGHCLNEIREMPEHIRIIHPFEKNVSYLLPLQGIGRSVSGTREGVGRPLNGDSRRRAFYLLDDLVINLDDIPLSSMRGNPLDLSETELGSIRSVSTDDILYFAYKHAQNEPSIPRMPRGTIIASAHIENIIHGSPLVLVIDIGELERASRSNWGHSDNYYVTIVRSLKGDISLLEDNLDIDLSMIRFLPDTVQTGDRVIVTLCDLTFNITARYSVYPMEYEQRIGEILGIR